MRYFIEFVENSSGNTLQRIEVTTFPSFIVTVFINDIVYKVCDVVHHCNTVTESYALSIWVEKIEQDMPT